jgi:hypothetical protein
VQHTSMDFIVGRQPKSVARRHASKGSTMFDIDSVGPYAEMLSELDDCLKAGLGLG